MIRVLGGRSQAKPVMNVTSFMAMKLFRLFSKRVVVELMYDYFV